MTAAERTYTPVCLLRLRELSDPMRRSASQFPAEWKLPKLLLAPDVERWIAAIPPGCASVSVTLGAWQQTGPFADARLQGALCILHRKGIRTSVNVPPQTLLQQRTFDALQDPNPAGSIGYSTSTERRLSGTLAGLVIGQLCKFDVSHQNIPALQRNELERKRYLFGNGPEVALAVPTEMVPNGVPRRSTIDREATFNRRLIALLGPLGINDKNHSSVSDWFGHLKSFAFEATENTWDHGRLDFQMNPIRSIRFVRLRRIDVGDKGYDAKKIAPGFEESFEHYVDCLNAAEDITDRWSPTGGRLAEITIADGGVGISARMAGGLEIYRDTLEAESQCLVDALVPTGTTKSSSEVGRGQGFRKMLRACSYLSGLLIVRTGRLKISHTFRKLDGKRESVNFNDANSSAYLPDISDVEFPLIAGTSISLIFPIHPRDRNHHRERP